ncbi:MULTISPECIES: TonB-dependent receptor [unclassified Shewanella]|uniref:TonB-dependent receptor n=1 Tax=unclassified Shewanella TaxID=196818 RepID=UPI001BC51527|nr:MULTISPECIES: TonB-dependent receptor [unclassified Shewanella]GIU20765.1 TonB-dependent receptor [Shewanella sp. MBTL60-112-B1]GIU29983.1 TonB-dependent receptor [Shewanella sp. MBTL60-112-B2]
MKQPGSLSPLYLALFASSLCIPNTSWAGRVEGSIKDITTQIPLEGAMISIEELNLKQESNRDGRFFFQEVPEGSYTLIAQYLGGETYREQIQVGEISLTQTDIELSGDGVEHIQVIGQRGALSKSLNRQRAADNLVSVLSADALGNFPDTNISEALQRVPGVSIERDQGEGRFVRVRGMAPDYNSVSMNGTRLPSPDSDRRAVALDVVPADLLQSVEVTKTLTPDMDADSLGGAIEVKSLSAFDRDERYVNVSAEGSYDAMTESTNPKLAASFSDIYQDKFGVAIAASWYDRGFGSDNVETGGKWSFDEPARLEEVEQRDYDINRERVGIGANFDFRPNDNNDLYLRTLYSSFVDTETRNSNEIKWDEATLPDVLGPAEATRSLKSREEDQSIVSLVFGGESRLEQWTLNYQASWSRAQADKPMYIGKADFEAGFDEVGYQDSQVPMINASEAFYSADEYQLAKIEIADSSTVDSMVAAKFDASKTLLLAERPLEVKFGAKYSGREKTNREDVWIYKDFDELGFTEQQLSMVAFAGSEPDYNLGRFGPSINADAVWDLVHGLDSDAAIDNIESQINDFDIDEDIAAAYVMGHIDIDNLRILAGVRFEHTGMYSKGTGFDESQDDFFATTYDRDYQHWLPGLHLNYKWGDKTVVRASWNNTIVRPTFGQLAPGYLIEQNDNELEAAFGNPDLEALESMNWDLSLEHYMGGLGVVSVSGFYKDISNFIYEADLGGYGKYQDFDKAETFVNGDDANILGMELAYVQEFGFMPEGWRGLIFTTNLTLSDSTAEIDWQDDGTKTRDIPLPSQSEVSANASFGYENPYVSFRFSASYKSEYLLEVAELDDAAFDIYQDAHTQYDFVAKGFITEDFTVYFKAINLSDEPFYAYTGQNRYNAQYEEYGRTFQLGIQYINF